MSDVLSEAQDRLPIGLYLELIKGSYADLEVSARASIAFAQALRELAHIIDPAIEVRIALRDSSEGSLSFNAVIEVLRKFRKSHPRLFAIAAGMTIWMGEHAAEHTYDKALDIVTHMIIGGEEKDALTRKDIPEIAAMAADAVTKGAARGHVQGIFKELQSDPAVAGVGVNRGDGLRPRVIVPRPQFAARARGLLQEREGARRERPEMLTVTLISPVLLETSRRWKLRSYFGEFGATVDDRVFLDSVLSGNVVLPMTSGIELDILLVNHDEFIDGVWQTRHRVVQKVFRVYERYPQSRLAFEAD